MSAANEVNETKPNKRWVVDPPSGWMYGFPKEIPEECKDHLREWLVAEGYPEKLIKEFGDYFYVRMWEKLNNEL